MQKWLGIPKFKVSLIKLTCLNAVVRGWVTNTHHIMHLPVTSILCMAMLNIGYGLV